MNFIFEPWHWFVLGIVLIISELFIPAFAALWFGIAALVVTILLWFFPSMSFEIQLILWGLLSTACTVFWFKYIKPLLVDRTKVDQRREAAIGQIGMVIQASLEQNQIKVRFSTPVIGADEWDCHAVAPVQVGDRVIVTDISGNQLVVRPYSSKVSTL